MRARNAWDVGQMAFTKAFVKHYEYVAAALGHVADKQRMSNCIVHISVQLLSPQQLATTMVTEHRLLHVMFASLRSMMEEILTVSGTGGQSSS